MTAVDAPLPQSSGLTWSVGLIASLAAHASALALLAFMLQPDPVQDQPQPKSQLRIETEQVAQSKAAEQAPQQTAAAAASAKGSQVSEGTVPQSQAKAVAMPQAKIAATTPPGQTEKPQAPAAEKLTQTAAPKAIKPLSAPTESLAPISATAEVVKTTSATAETLPPVSATTEPVKPVAAPTASKALAPASPAAPVQSTTGDAITEATPDAQPIASAPATGDHMVAALAWSGEDTQIDPQSLKAIQSFMQPGDTAAQSDDVHDALSSVLTSVPCSRLQAEFNPATGSLELRGHVPDEALRAPILKALQEQVGTGIKVADAMLILPRPQCGALSGIADVGLPQSQDQNTNPRLIGADAQAKAYTYTTGQTMVLDLAAPDYDAYLYVDFFDADGQVIHLVPNETVPLKLRPAKTAMHVGAADAGEPFLHITIGPPYGQEIAAAFAASAPLYDGLRPMSEPAAPYLDWLKGRVAEARTKNPDFKGEWVYFFVSTKK